MKTSRLLRLLAGAGLTVSGVAILFVDAVDAGAPADVTISTTTECGIPNAGPEQDTGSVSITVTNPPGGTSPNTYSVAIEPGGDGGFGFTLADGESQGVGAGKLAPGDYVITVTVDGVQAQQTFTIEPCAVEATTTEATTTTTLGTTTTVPAATSEGAPQDPTTTSIAVAPAATTQVVEVLGATAHPAPAATIPAVGWQLPATGATAPEILALASAFAFLGTAVLWITGSRTPRKSR